MEKEKLLTIAIPVYNGAKTIENMMDTLLAQYDERLDILISDNCSTDNTPEIISKYRKKYSYIRYVRNKVNHGPDFNFLQCMQKAMGKFTWLVSDDDVIIEGAVDKILAFLNKYSKVSLVYLTTVDFRGKYIDLEHCTIHKPILQKDICTKNKCEFVRYAGQYWGFMSSFICKTNRFLEIKNPQQYFGTFWLQSYIHALCASNQDVQLGLIKAPCVGAGIYINTANFDSALVNGVFYKQLLDFMVNNAGFDARQLEKLYVWRICLLGRHDILKERATGISKLNKRLLFQCTWHYPKAWLTLYPAFLVPGFVCRPVMNLYRRLRGIQGEIRINRPE